MKLARKRLPLATCCAVSTAARSKLDETLMLMNWMYDVYVGDEEVEDSFTDFVGNDRTDFVGND
jgi:hypothetical protein